MPTKGIGITLSQQSAFTRPNLFGLFYLVFALTLKALSGVLSC